MNNTEYEKYSYQNFSLKWFKFANTDKSPINIYYKVG